MKLIIHDLSNEDFSSISKNIRGDNIVISKGKGINRCIGCFGCWIKTPGDSEGQGSLACWSPWGHKESHNLVTEQEPQ